MTADHWIMVVLCGVTLGYVLYTMARIVTVQREIAAMVRDLHRP